MQVAVTTTLSQTIFPSGRSRQGPVKLSAVNCRHLKGTANSLR